MQLSFSNKNKQTKQTNWLSLNNLNTSTRDKLLWYFYTRQKQNTLKHHCFLAAIIYQDTSYYALLHIHHKTEHRFMAIAQVKLC